MPARLRLVDLVGYGLQTGGHLHEILPDRVLGREFGEPPTVRGLFAKNFAEVSHRASRRHCPRRATFRLSTSSHWSTVAIVRCVPRPD